MNQNGTNPHIAFGRPSYNPATQSQTDGEVWMAQIYPGFEDPTQVPMRPGDTDRPIQPPQQLNGQAANNPLQQVAQMMEQMRQVQQAMTQLPTTQQGTFWGETEEHKLPPQPVQYAAVQSQQNAVQPIRVPLVFDLTFNLTINLNINPVQQGGS